MVDEIKAYDVALVEKFRTIAQDPIEGSVTVPIVFAAPHRAYARVQEVYGQVFPSDTNRPELPIMAITRNDLEPDETRYVHHPRVIWESGLEHISDEVLTIGTGVRRITGTLGTITVVPGSLTISEDSDGPQVVTDDGDGNIIGDVDGSGTNTIDYETGEYDISFNVPILTGVGIKASYKSPSDSADTYASEYPQPVRIPYQINIWTSQRGVMNNILKQCSLRVRNNIGYIEVDLEEFGVKRFSFDYESVTDSSELTPGDTERNIRYTISLTLRCMLFREIRLVKVLEEAEIAFYKDNDLPENLLETMTVTGN